MNICPDIDPAGREEPGHAFLRLRFLLLPAGPSSSTPAGDGGLHAPYLRRMLGLSLVRRFCPFSAPVCESDRPGEAIARCGQAGSCPYGVLFARSLTGRPPLALFVPTEAGRDGTRSLEISLFGPAAGLYPWIVASLAGLLAKGVGKGRNRWRVIEVARLRPGLPPEPVCGPQIDRLPPGLQPDRFEPGIDPGLADPAPVTVRLLSPVILERDGRRPGPDDPVPFWLLIERILDRVGDLYGRESSPLLDRGVRQLLRESAGRVEVVREDRRWLTFTDYSVSRKVTIDLSGPVGVVEYGPEAARFLPILRVGEIVHVGRNAAEGCGRIEIGWDEE